MFQVISGEHQKGCKIEVETHLGRKGAGQVVRYFFQRVSTACLFGCNEDPPICFSEEVGPSVDRAFLWPKQSFSSKTSVLCEAESSRGQLSCWISTQLTWSLAKFFVLFGEVSW